MKHTNDLRTEIAASCLNGLLTSQTQGLDAKNASKWAVEHADALLERLEGVEVQELPTSIIWHNPNRLTGEEIGTKDGWRLLISEEIGSKNDFYIDAWMRVSRCWAGDNFKGGLGSITYRTKSPLPEKYRHLLKQEKPAPCCYQDIVGKQNRIRNEILSDFLKKCLSVTFVCPVSKNAKNLIFGKVEGVCELNDNLELDYYNGETYNLAQILCIYPSVQESNS